MISDEPRPAEMLGMRLGNYRVISKLGEGGMGVVYVGRHEALGQRVAVKVLQPELSRDTEMVRRFFNEAQAATAIRNLGIVQIFDFGTTTDGRAYFVMELLEGQPLGARFKKRRIDFIECCRIGRQIANVLQAAHEAGITHRDLKPDNLFLVPDVEAMGGERVKVLDFGIAKLAGEVHAISVKTRTGLVLGTPTYMSPEQCRGAGAIDARSDIYSLGCILFEMVCGCPPFVGEGVGEIIGAHLHVPPPQAQSLAPDIPAELAALIAKMIAKRPDARPPTMAAVSQALDEILCAVGVPVRASTPLPVPSPTTWVDHATTPTAQNSSQSTTLGGSTGTTIADEHTRAHPLLRLVFASLVVAGLLAAIFYVFPMSGSDSAKRKVASDERAMAPQSGIIAVIDAGGHIPDAVMTPPDAETEAVIAPIVAPAPPASVAVAQAKPAASNNEVQIECFRYRKNENWSALGACADRLQQLNPRLAQELKTQAVMEIRSAPRIRDVEVALQDKDLKRAKAEFDQIWTGSTSYQQTKLKYENLEIQVINNVIAQLERVTDCEEYNAILARERAENPPHVAAEAAYQIKCTAKPLDCNHKEFADRGIEQYARSEFAAALASYEQAWRCKHDAAYAEKIFIIACNSTNAEKARLFWKRLPAEMQRRALRICERNGITEEKLNAP
jgi:eukaryotic-like serine/threonine-protein kinase